MAIRKINIGINDLGYQVTRLGKFSDSCKSRSELRTAVLAEVQNRHARRKPGKPKVVS